MWIMWNYFKLITSFICVINIVILGISKNKKYSAHKDNILHEISKPDIFVLFAVFIVEVFIIWKYPDCWPIFFLLSITLIKQEIQNVYNNSKYIVNAVITKHSNNMTVSIYEIEIFASSLLLLMCYIFNDERRILKAFATISHNTIRSTLIYLFLSQYILLVIFNFLLMILLPNKLIAAFLKKREIEENLKNIIRKCWMNSGGAYLIKKK